MISILYILIYTVYYNTEGTLKATLPTSHNASLHTAQLVWPWSVTSPRQPPVDSSALESMRLVDNLKTDWESDDLHWCQSAAAVIGPAANHCPVC